MIIGGMGMLTSFPVRGGPGWGITRLADEIQSNLHPFVATRSEIARSPEEARPPNTPEIGSANWPSNGAQLQTDPAASASYPSDPSADIPWQQPFSGVGDIQAAFNDARAAENGMIGAVIQPMTLPSQSLWNAMDDGERALWLINQERSGRGLAPFHGVESNVTAVAQAWAEWLLAHNAFDHNADGSSPYLRMDANPVIAACRDPLQVSENLFFVGTTYSQGNALPIEYAVYTWMYDDKKYGWGHRHALLWTPLNENSGPGDREGLIGIGHARGGYVNPFDGNFYPIT
ncbi:MAG: hypothetical protein HC802_22535, partial [Caldilineaceae bacterium]|nr:hypothetical protein [Caldilineaceae bacterium]